jgi:hypothetical protein
MLTDSPSQSLPILNSFYTEENLQNGVTPLYLQSKFSKGDSKFQILVSF